MTCSSPSSATHSRAKHDKKTHLQDLEHDLLNPLITKPLLSYFLKNHIATTNSSPIPTSAPSSERGISDLRPTSPSSYEDYSDPNGEFGKSLRTKLDDFFAMDMARDTSKFTNRVAYYSESLDFSLGSDTSSSNDNNNNTDKDDDEATIPLWMSSNSGQNRLDSMVSLTEDSKDDASKIIDELVRLSQLDPNKLQNSRKLHYTGSLVIRLALVLIKNTKDKNFMKQFETSKPSLLSCFREGSLYDGLWDQAQDISKCRRDPRNSSKLEAIVEILYLSTCFGGPIDNNEGDVKDNDKIESDKDTDRVALLFKLLNEFSATYRCKDGYSDSAKSQALRISHKILHYLTVFWKTRINESLPIGSNQNSYRKVFDNSELLRSIEKFNTSFDLLDDSEIVPMPDSPDSGIPITTTASKSTQRSDDTCSARSTVRHLYEIGLKFPGLHEITTHLSLPLYYFVHPFDGYMTKVSELCKLPKLPSVMSQDQKSPAQSDDSDDSQIDRYAKTTIVEGSEKDISQNECNSSTSEDKYDDLTQILLNSSTELPNLPFIDPQKLLQRNTFSRNNGNNAENNLNFCPITKPPKAIWDAMRMSIKWTKPDAIEIQYAKLWHQMVADWGPPPTLQSSERVQPLSNDVDKGSKKKKMFDIGNLPPLAPTLEEFRKSQRKIPTAAGVKPKYGVMETTEYFTNGTKFNYSQDGNDDNNNIREEQAPAQDMRGIGDGVMMGGIVEREDMVGLERYLDNNFKDIDNETECNSDDNKPSTLYEKLFPHLSGFSKSCNQMVMGWIPTHKETFTSYSIYSPNTLDSLPVSLMLDSDVLHSNKSAPSSPFMNKRSISSDDTTTPINIRRISRENKGRSTMKSSPFVSSSDTDKDFVGELEATMSRIISSQSKVVGELVGMIFDTFQRNGDVLQAEYLGHLLIDSCGWVSLVLKWIGFLNLEYIKCCPKGAAKYSFCNSIWNVVFQGSGTKAKHGSYQNSRHLVFETDCGDNSREKGEIGRDRGGNELMKMTFLANSSKKENNNKDDYECNKIHGLYNMIRTLRTLTRRHILRRYLLHQNNAQFFLKKILWIDDIELRSQACDILKDIMPFIGQNWEKGQGDMWLISMIYMYSKPSLHDTFWLEKHYFNFHVEQTRLQELLRLIRYYHTMKLNIYMPKLVLDADLLSSGCRRSDRSSSKDDNGEPSESEQDIQELFLKLNCSEPSLTIPSL